MIIFYLTNGEKNLDITKPCYSKQTVPDPPVLKVVTMISSYAQ